LWIRSQDDEVLLNLDRVTAIKHHKLYEELDANGPINAVVAYTVSSENYDFIIGRYFTSKRVDEIMEEIEDEIEKDTCTVYYMPLE
jgi:hypothetical protein